MKFGIIQRYIFTIAVVFIDKVKASHTNFEIKRFESCNKTQGYVGFHGNITKQNGKHYISYTMSSPIDFDERIGVFCQIYSKPIGNSFIELFAIRERYACKAGNMYLGELWYDIERAAQIPPGVCPIRAGRYSVHHALLDFNKISLQTFPYGRLRFIISAVDNQRKINNIACFIVEVENRLD